MTEATWHEPARDLPIIARPDVLVVGAGSAGIAAALASARRGADTMLIEGQGSIGGLATFGLINLLLTLDDGEGTQVVAGLCQEVVDALDRVGAARFPQHDEWGSEDLAAVDRWRRFGLIWGAPPEVVRYSVAFEPEAFVTAAFDLLDSAGVRVRLHTTCVTAHATDGRIEAVVVESKAGREVIVPGVVVDTTGDGDVFTRAGAPADSVEIYPYQWFRMGGVTGLEERDDAFAGGLYFRTTDAGRVLVPWGGPGFAPSKVDPLDPDAVTQATLDCRHLVLAEVARLQAEAPGFEHAWLDDVARTLGVTESRRLLGDYVLEKEDGDRRFEDSVAQTGHWTRRGVTYDIPYRCLTTPSLTNLLAAGRCISASRYVHQATKEIPAAMATGEAAGAAAAAALGVDARVHDVDVGALRADLAAGGAIVGGAQPA